MLGFFTSQESKMRRNAGNWLEVADKVWATRRDVLPAPEARDLVRLRDELRKGLKTRADAGKLKLQIESLEEALKRSGGTVYPKTTLVDYVEFLVVAAIVILGIRTYFVQPFKIPTNSMWPSYYGMTDVNYLPNKPVPGPAESAFRFLTLGAQRYQMVAPADGELSVLVIVRDHYVQGRPAGKGADFLASTRKSGRSWLVLPADLREYTFFVDGVPATVDVPADFGSGPDERAGGFDDLFVQSWFGSWENYREYCAKALPGSQAETFTYDAATGMQGVAYRLHTGRYVHKGDPLIRFDILTGDQLFVDRFSYHFFPPKPGDGFVFRTDNIPQLQKADYFIKRLVGVPGDTISIDPPYVIRNGAHITGARAFELNQNRVPPYTGYTREYPTPDWWNLFLPDDKQITVPYRHYFAMGDNSSNSEDSRYWGLVNGDDVIGRPLFVYFPFTRRWGPAH
ncbi:MAG TPA: signal peptidase I [Opitutaceae bacterium]|jgi:signal peptidase I